MSDLIERKDAIMALRLEYPMMPFFKENRKEWAIKTEGYRKAEEVIMKLPSVDTPTTMTGVIDAIREAEYRGCMKAVEERPKGEWTSVLAELHERFSALEKELRRASAEMSAIIREYVDRPKGERIAIGAVCEVICKHCIKANGCCQHHWKCPLLTEIAELIESKDEPQTVLEAVLERQTDEDRRKMEESIRKAIKDEQSGKE